MRFVLEGLTERVRLIEVVRERVTVGDRERLTEVVGDFVKGAVVAIAERDTVWVIDRVNGAVVGMAVRDTV